MENENRNKIEKFKQDRRYKTKLKKFDSFCSDDFDDYREFDSLIGDLATFDLYIMFLMVKNEMMKRGFDNV